MWAVQRPIEADLLTDVIAAGESLTAEFKRSLPPDHVIARVLTAFANAAGGILIIGVADRGDIVGLRATEVAIAKDRLEQIIRSLEPADRWEWEVGDAIVAERRVAYAYVGSAPESARPMATSRGELFVRTDAGELPMSVKAPPTTGPPRSLRRTFRVFVAMSFREEEEPALVDYWRAMNRAAKVCGASLDVRRIDLREGDYEISQEIMSEIDAADIVIADFTLSSRNVYFELGYARGRRKRLVQTARKDVQLEFDIRNWRTLFYRNATELEEKLTIALAEAAAELAAG